MVDPEDFLRPWEADHPIEGEAEVFVGNLGNFDTSPELGIEGVAVAIGVEIEGAGLVAWVVSTTHHRVQSW